MDIRKIKKLIELLEESGIAEIEIKEGEEAVRISRMPTGRRCASRHAAPTPCRMAAPAAPAAAAPAPPPAPQPPRPRAAPNEHVVDRADGRHLLSPRPRPARSRSSRSASEVKAGQVLCIIEAMKMMNQIESGQGRQGHLDHGARTATRSSSASRCSSSNNARRHARENRHRQPRRDRAADPARLPRARHQDRRRALHRRLQPQARAARRRVGLHRPAAVAEQLPQHARDHQRGGSHRLRRHPSRLRLPLRERGLRRARGEERLHVHRPARPRPSA